MTLDVTHKIFAGPHLRIYSYTKAEIKKFARVTDKLCSEKGYKRITNFLYQTKFYKPFKFPNFRNYTKSNGIFHISQLFTIFTNFSILWTLQILRFFKSLKIVQIKQNLTKFSINILNKIYWKKKNFWPFFL